MKTVWRCSLETEALRVIDIAHYIFNGFFRKNNLPIVPYGYPKEDCAAVHFPDLDYHSIPRFWERVRKVGYDKFPVSCDINLVKNVSELLREQEYKLPEYDELKNDWAKAESAVMKEICRLIPWLNGQVKGIIAYPTLFGTWVSFSVPDKFHTVMKIYIKEKEGIYSMAEGLVTGLTRSRVFSKLEGNWEESEIVSDWILFESSLNTVLRRFKKPTADFTPTMKRVRINQKGRLLADSENFYRKLGINFEDKPFSIKSDVPHYSDKPLDALTAREKLLLREMINKQGQVLSYDEISQLIFHHEDDFSLYVISKIIQNLRDKLERNSITGSYIQAVRGQGYLLNQ